MKYGFTDFIRNNINDMPLLLLIILSIPLKPLKCENHEFRLLGNLIDIFGDKTYQIRPVKNSSSTTNIDFGISLVQILEVNVKDQSISVLLWKKLSWTDQVHTWSPEEYGNITSMEIQPGLLWTPDIYLYNKYKKIILDLSFCFLFIF